MSKKSAKNLFIITALPLAVSETGGTGETCQTTETGETGCLTKTKTKTKTALCGFFDGKWILEERMAGGHCWRVRELASLSKLTPPILNLYNTFLTEGFPLIPKSKMASQKNTKK